MLFILLVVKNNHAVCSFHCQIIKLLTVLFLFVFYFCSIHGDRLHLVTIWYAQMEKPPLCILGDLSCLSSLC